MSPIQPFRWSTGIPFFLAENLTWFNPQGCSYSHTFHMICLYIRRIAGQGVSLSASRQQEKNSNLKFLTARETANGLQFVSKRLKYLKNTDIVVLVIVKISEWTSNRHSEHTANSDTYQQYWNDVPIGTKSYYRNTDLICLNCTQSIGMEEDVCMIYSHNIFICTLCTGTDHV